MGVGSSMGMTVGMVRAWESLGNGFSSIHCLVVRGDSDACDECAGVWVCGLTAEALRVGRRSGRGGGGGACSATRQTGRARTGAKLNRSLSYRRVREGSMLPGPIRCSLYRFFTCIARDTPCVAERSGQFPQREKRGLARFPLEYNVASSPGAGFTGIVDARMRVF